ncbi:MAG: nitrous oxide reductase family maturation protein NosD [Sulfurospirillum sp.]
MRKSFIIFTLFLTLPLLANQSLKQIITLATPGSKIELPKGVFKGPIIIDKPLIISGAGKDSIIENSGNGTVITIKSSDVNIENLTIRGSGHQRYNLDSGVKVENALHVEIKNCNFYKTLFGIVFHNTKYSKIIDNTITSYKEKVVDNRGDGIRLYNSSNNLIENNNLSLSRDIALSRSNHNKIKNNTMKNGRYGVLSDMSNDISIRSNKIYSNYVGVRCKGGKNINIANNIIIKTHLSTGIGIMLDGGKNIHVSHNTLSGHAQAIYISSSPVEIGMQRYIKYNSIINNNVAFHFYTTIKNNTIKYNNIVGNLEDVVKDVSGEFHDENSIEENYWDRYIGFDKNGDGISDIPYLVLIYADKLWQYNHQLKFFYATPLLSIIDFMERLAPFDEPTLLLKDTKPKVEPVSNAGVV